MTLTTRKLVFARDQFIDQNGRSAAHFRQWGVAAPHLYINERGSLRAPKGAERYKAFPQALGRGLAEVLSGKCR